MRALTVSGAARVAGVAGAAGALVGLLVRLASSAPLPVHDAAAAMTVLLAAGATAGALARSDDQRILRLAFVAGAAWMAAAAAGLAAGGGARVLGAALVPAATAALAFGVAAFLRSLRCDRGVAAFAATGVALLPAALVFVADPWIEWGEMRDATAPASSTASSPARARAVLTASPLAAMTSEAGGLGVDWQRMGWLYDGPADGVPGLSLVGQYYPSVPPAPLAWGAVVLGIGAALVVASRRSG